MSKLVFNTLHVSAVMDFYDNMEMCLARKIIAEEFSALKTHSTNFWHFADRASQYIYLSN